MDRNKRRQAPLILSTDASHRLEQFLIAGVATVLIVRLYLHLSGYPQLGGHGLHVAHLLWGGLLMLVALIMRLAYLGRRTKAVAAIVGGVGFGLFIDEIGKFVTSDNNYFYQPAVALIYIAFVLLFLAFRAMQRRQQLTPESALVNALDLTKDAAMHHWTTDEKHRALALLRHSDQTDPLVIALTGALEQTVAQPAQVTRLSRLATCCSDWYDRFVRARWFQVAVVVVCALKVVSAVGAIATLVVNYRSTLVSSSDSAFVMWSDTASTIVEAALVVIGLIALTRGSRPAAYERFKQAVLVTIFIGTFLTFYREQFWGLSDLIVNLVILSVLEYMISQERLTAVQQELMPGAPATLPMTASAEAEPAR